MQASPIVKRRATSLRVLHLTTTPVPCISERLPDVLVLAPFGICLPVLLRVLRLQYDYPGTTPPQSIPAA